MNSKLEKNMTEKNEKHSGARSEKNTDANPSERRSPRSIRYSDSEWKSVEKVAKERGMAAAELVRHISVSYAAGKFSAEPSGNTQTLLPRMAAQIERIYNGVYLMATLKRDEMLVDGRQDEVDRIVEHAQKSQELIGEYASD